MTSLYIFYLGGVIALLALAIVLLPTIIYRRKKDLDKK